MIVYSVMLIGIVLMTWWPSIAVGQIPQIESPTANDHYLKSIREFSEIHNGIRLKGRGKRTQYRDGVATIEALIEFRLVSNGDGSYRHVDLSEVLSLVDRGTKTVQRLEGFYDRDYGVLNARSFVNDASGKNYHQLDGYLKSYRVGHVNMMWLGYGLGISHLDEDSIGAYFLPEVKTLIEKKSEGGIELSSTLIGQGKCTVRFGAGNKISGYTVEKSKKDSFLVRRVVGDGKIKEDEHYRSIRAEVSEFQYRDEIVAAFKVSEEIIGDGNSRLIEVCEFSIERDGSFAKETDKPTGLRILKDVPKETLLVVIKDDPNVRYVPDGDGRVKKVVDRRGFSPDKPGGLHFLEELDDNPLLNENDDNGVVFEDYLRSHTQSFHCGVYCLANAFVALGVEFRIEDLLDSRYISRFEGSSQEDLKLACKDHGVEAVDVANLPLATLRNLDSPVLLLLDQDPSRMNHWILFKRDHDGKAVILDPPREEEVIDYRYLLTQWTGKALVLGRSNLPARWHYDAVSEKLTFAVVPFFCVLGVLPRVFIAGIRPHGGAGRCVDIPCRG
jgi:Peptidase C39 family